MNPNSLPALYPALILNPKVFLSFANAWRIAPLKVFKLPPINSIEVPGWSIAFLVKKWTTPDSTANP